MSRIQKSGYGNLEWLNAILAKKDRQAVVSEEEAAKNVVERAAEAAFKIQPKEESNEQRIRRASLEIEEQKAAARDLEYCARLRDKLAARNIDPVALGITTKAEWENSMSPSWIEAVAKHAALAYEKHVSASWEERAVSRQAPQVRPDVETSMAGRIMSSAGANEETRGQTSRVPANANSILDPDRLAKLFTQPNAHDEAIEERLASRKAREQMKKDELAPRDLGPAPMKDGSISRSGGKDCEAFVQRVPKNQISMTDNLGDTSRMSREEMAEKLSQLFTSKVPDSGQEIRQQNAERKQSITRQAEGDRREWDSEEHLRPQSTSDLQERLMRLWLPPGE